MNNEWIFDNASVFYIMKQIEDPKELALVPFDTSRIKWNWLIQNHAYGLKKYVLEEEAYIPSLGYSDCRIRMFYPQTAKVMQPLLGTSVFFKKIRNYEETKQMVFSSKWVKQEQAKLV